MSNPHLIHKDGSAVQEGDEVTDFRGDTAIVRGWQYPVHSNSTGRVDTDEGSYYPSVYELKWSE